MSTHSVSDALTRSLDEGQIAITKVHFGDEIEPIRKAVDALSTNPDSTLALEDLDVAVEEAKRSGVSATQIRVALLAAPVALVQRYVQ